MREGGGVVQLLGHPLPCPCHQVRHEDLVVFVLVVILLSTLLSLWFQMMYLDNKLNLRMIKSQPEKTWDSPKTPSLSPESTWCLRAHEDKRKDNGNSVGSISENSWASGVSFYWWDERLKQRSKSRGTLLKLVQSVGSTVQVLSRKTKYLRQPSSRAPGRTWEMARSWTTLPSSLSTRTWWLGPWISACTLVRRLTRRMTSSRLFQALLVEVLGHIDELEKVHAKLNPWAWQI